MIVQVQNENYGYRVATFGDYVAVANPFITRWNAASASFICTGSVEYYRYNKATDLHDLVGKLFREWDDIPVLLTTEAAGSVSGSSPLHTESSSIDVSTSDLDIAIDKDKYTASYEDGFGLAMDMNETLLVVGSPYFNQVVRDQEITLSWTGSVVDVFDLAKSQYLTQDPFAFSQDQQTFVYEIDSPDPTITASFGSGVAINDNWIAVGSPLVSSSAGMVYMYQNISTGSNNYSWSLYQKITLTGSVPGAMFGSDLKLNKGNGSFAPDMIVGCGNVLNAQAYYFSFINGSWTHTYTLNPTRDIYPLTFGGYAPYSASMNYSNGFGTAVSIFNDTIVVGAPYDRLVYEYNSSSLYQQGSTYVFERCPQTGSTLWQLVLKTYGNSNTLKNNLMGYSVDIYGDYIISGIPKTNMLGQSGPTATSCLLASTIEQLHQCEADLDKTLIGQYALLQRNTQSGEWGILNIYQKKKEFLNTYKSFGFDVSIADKSLVVGSPMLIADLNRLFNVNVTASGDIVKLGDISGKAYIYDLNNLQNQFHVGNVFYRNGKIILMTSGSIFDGLFFNPISIATYEYDVMFKAQHTIFEKQIVCSINPGEFNVSTNPTAIIRTSCSLDVNGNGIFDFQDVDVLLRYMQYKNTSILGLPVSTDWSSSIVTSVDEKSLLNFYQYNSPYEETYTSYLASESIVRWELNDTSMQTTLDLNQDNRIDFRDMNILWKYFTNRLTQTNYSTYITPACHRKLFSDVIDYLNKISQKNAQPYINPMFLQYENLTAFDKTGSFLAPMVTTIGLYSGLDLVAVAKLGSPIKITPELPINIVIKMDF